MDTEAQLNHKRMTLWILATTVFVAVVAYLSDPPCDKPVKRACQIKQSLADLVSTPEQGTAESPEVESWTTAEGMSVSFVYKPSLNQLSVQLMIEPETSEENTQLQTVHSMTIPSLMQEDNGMLLDTESVKKTLSNLVLQGSPSRISVSLEGGISQEQARQFSEVVSQVLHQSQTASDSSPQG